MNTKMRTYVGLAALAALSYGCSSTSTATGTGGTLGGGTGGSSVTGGGGQGGSGSGASCLQGGDVPPAKNPAMCVGVSNKAVCNSATDAPCWNTCGPNKSGYKNCTCTGNIWDCPICSYTPDTNICCYKITTQTVACVKDPTDPGDNMGMGLPKSGGVCKLPECTPCGNATANSYADSTGAPKSGFCICVPNADPTMPAKYSCTSAKEYPSAALLQ